MVVEFDGLVKYAGQQGRAALAAEKARESAIVDLGYEVVRLVWADLANPAEVARRIRTAHARAVRAAQRRRLTAHPRRRSSAGAQQLLRAGRTSAC